MMRAKNKNLFIHIPKNAGTTVRKTFKDRIILASKENLVSDEYVRRLTQVMHQAGEHPGYEHARWRDIKEAIRNSHQSVAVVRNPWMKVGSRFMYGQRHIAAGRIAKTYMASTFEEFLEERHTYVNSEFYWHRPIRGWYPQLDHVTDHEGKVQCNIIRFEFFEDEIRQYFNVTDTQIISKHHGHRQHVTPSLAKWDIDYKTLYNDRTIQTVADWYKDDVDYFGFDFDTTATRNYWCE